jgi:hypothetical protein
VGLERGPLSLVSTTEELLGRRSSGSGLEAENTAVGIRHSDHATPLYPKKLALSSPTSGGRSVGIVRSRSTHLPPLHHVMIARRSSGSVGLCRCCGLFCQRKQTYVLVFGHPELSMTPSDP